MKFSALFCVVASVCTVLAAPVALPVGSALEARSPLEEAREPPDWKRVAQQGQRPDW
ncbi:hypothetical protein CY34DRAFT_11802 [Suillus luteus UH-Slu-Lm8-n1]|uniref:Uncharacterized protein n=1 Tax=Suillus luteus UH-Slu-Lm8-n1 TaxID=930992 RepID=A0A0D0A0B7_9AGAM|nr:hypothetical protein CY34DRAFT_11802 [Suillus luteus UH-Slu-Lm8-n1]